MNRLAASIYGIGSTISISFHGVVESLSRLECWGKPQSNPIKYRTRKCRLIPSNKEGGNSTSLQARLRRVRSRGQLPFPSTVPLAVYGTQSTDSEQSHSPLCVSGLVLETELMEGLLQPFERFPRSIFFRKILPSYQGFSAVLMSDLQRQEMISAGSRSNSHSIFPKHLTTLLLRTGWHSAPSPGHVGFLIKPFEGTNLGARLKRLTFSFTDRAHMAKRNVGA